MKLASLFSGGKDSIYAIYKAISEGHQISCLVTVFPNSAESHLLHHPNIQLTSLQAESMAIPQIAVKIGTDETKVEVEEIRNAFENAVKLFGVEGMVHGGILSSFQKHHFESVCKSLDLATITPLWKVNQTDYMRDLARSKFRFVITSVSSEGLDEYWLGKAIAESDIERLIHLAMKFSFNASFEGGEAETFVTDCPLFSSPISILKSNKVWDGYRGRFEITEAALAKHC